MADLQDQLRREEDARNELEEHIKSLKLEVDNTKNDLAVAKATGGAVGAVAGAAVVGAADSARLAELEVLLESKTKELNEMENK